MTHSPCPIVQNVSWTNVQFPLKIVAMIFPAVTRSLQDTHTYSHPIIIDSCNYCFIHRLRDIKPSQGLDMNLWPLCMNSQIHDLDKLIMTQMSPGNVTDVLLQEIHDIRKINISLIIMFSFCSVCMST